jgi:alkylation response protein AidB-like acyl-CoA dehydrogenase
MPTARLGERNDLICASIEHKMGIHGSATAVMSFGENAGAIGYLVGEENQGLGYMFTMMNHARLNVGLEGVGDLRARLPARPGLRPRPHPGQASSATRPARRSPSCITPDVRRMLMDMKARTEAMRAIAYYAAGQMDRAHGHADADQRANAQALSIC